MAWPVKHGLCKQYANEYGVWISMKSRCLRRTHRAYEDYGGRGITVCERWMQFANFFADTGPRPSEGLSLDRIDNEKGYWCGKAECSECGPLCREKNWRWATREEQQRNTRASIMITYRGETRTIPEWSERLGIPASLIRRRVGYRAKNLLAPPRGKSTERRSLLTQTRRIWRSMIWRCQNEHAINFDRYGGRGIRVCDEWQEFAVFLADMGERPSPDHTLDRIDSDGNYEPSNCRWATVEVQQANRRKTQRRRNRTELVKQFRVDIS
jgi:hypothetical protein